MNSNLAKSPTLSPLLGSPIIERDYTKGIEHQLDTGGPAPGPEQGGGAAPVPDDEIKQDQTFHENFNPDETQGFKFDQPEDASDVGSGGEPGFSLAGTSAKAFANTLGDLIKVYVPALTYSYAKVDINSIKQHIDHGNISPGGYDGFMQVNESTLKSLQFEDDEIKMWKKACKEYMEYKNFAGANPENSFYIATAALIGVHSIKTVQCRRQNEDLIRQVISSYNPEFFNTQPAKEAEPEKEESKTDKTKL